MIPLLKNLQSKFILLFYGIFIFFIYSCTSTKSDKVLSSDTLSLNTNSNVEIYCNYLFDEKYYSEDDCVSNCKKELEWIKTKLDTKKFKEINLMNDLNWNPYNDLIFFVEINDKTDLYRVNNPETDTSEILFYLNGLPIQDLYINKVDMEGDQIFWFKIPLQMWSWEGVLRQINNEEAIKVFGKDYKRQYPSLMTLNGTKGFKITVKNTLFNNDFENNSKSLIQEKVLSEGYFLASFGE
ncbi:hypothetical protein [Kordia sp.]|uniref:hypothetical protein n=1 Tax=Kordia sp. TaxID=1965332 RepID=UPI003D6C4950